MPKINEAMDTDLKVIERLQQIGWKQEDRLFYQHNGL
jgi:G:T-mismatch repair DNA endonuclease (very short patch repair protein)